MNRRLAAGGVKRVCLTGVESTGKSTLAPSLAARFGGVVMPEYGRQWAESHGTDFTVGALRAIAAGHVAARAAIETARPALIIEDTDVVMTSAWSWMLHGARDPLLTDIPASADRYLLFAPDTPWTDDGTRQFGGERRQAFHAIIVAELAARGIVPVPVAGGWAERRRIAETAVAVLQRRDHGPV